MSPQLQQIGAQLSMVVDMAKGIMGGQFAVSLVCRHRVGPMHLLIGDDTEAPLIAALKSLEGVSTDLGAGDGVKAAE